MSSQKVISSGNCEGVAYKQARGTGSLDKGVSEKLRNDSEVSLEQNRYASILLVCSWAGIFVMSVTFLLYMGGLFNPVIEPSQIPRYWQMNVHQYALATHAPNGWTWLGLLNHADYLCLVGLAFLGTVSVLGYVSLLIDYLRKKDVPYIAMVSLEIVVIVLAASGIIHVSS
ncbi:membrane af1562 transmembrane [Acididesulfobacillus acetoxydans]|uniref:Membrane af1562 transmembrane n=1 Tax=Acididesulfobacillus acetoxydans TaxID=1561005 RepID=A0A8S0WE83_9FIRM|nr:DUF1634 domain-containing protein [Acididesulfobacillus acetoxydans]CAA7599932.1 membrane af1562 transmembrane [Acididesulfobacillus acetoxydans]CEJ07976.1 Hypothetical protein DEACI_2451 [Acididesulfobacillus acetoxydans]